MKSLLKYGGLAFSAALTISLFTRLFGLGAYGLTMATAALALFELGAAGWSHLLKTARDDQRQIARVCLSITVALSLLSSITEIIMATKLGEASLKALDLEFITLGMIALALAANVVGAIIFEYATPELTNKMRELDRHAKAQKAKHDYQDKVFDRAITKTEEKIDEEADKLADYIAEGYSAEIKARLREVRTLPPALEAPRELPALSNPTPETVAVTTRELEDTQPLRPLVNVARLEQTLRPNPNGKASVNGNGNHP